MHGSPRRNFYNRKGYWKRRFKELDSQVMELLNHEVAALKIQPLSSYMLLGNRILEMGDATEKLMEQAVALNLGASVKRDLAHSAMMLDLFSTKLRQVAEAKWGDALLSFPLYKTPFEVAGEMVPSEGMNELDEILGGEND